MNETGFKNKNRERGMFVSTRNDCSSWKSKSEPYGGSSTGVWNLRVSSVPGRVEFTLSL